MLYNLLIGANPVDLFTVEPGSKRLEGLPPRLQEILISGRRSGAHYQSSLGLAVGQGAGIGAPRWRVVFTMRAD